jgi:hypothetical protein
MDEYKWGMNCTYLYILAMDTIKDKISWIGAQLIQRLDGN